MRRDIIGKCEMYHADCMEVMKRYPDEYFDLAIVDPPYGSGIYIINGVGSNIDPHKPTARKEESQPFRRLV